MNRKYDQNFDGVGVATFFGVFDSERGVVPASLQDRFGFRPFSDAELGGKEGLDGAYFVSQAFRPLPDANVLGALLGGYHKVIVLGVSQGEFRKRIRDAVIGLDFASGDGARRQALLAADRGFLGSQWHTTMSPAQIRQMAKIECMGKCGASQKCRERGCSCNPLLGQCV